MFIELTDHLRCLADHDEAYLVLLPDRMEGRDVRAGHVGCPLCGWTAAIRDGMLDYGTQAAPQSAAPRSATASSLTAEALHSFLGLSGPGGFAAVVGLDGMTAERLATLLPGVHVALINPRGTPPRSVPADLSVLYAPRLPLKQSSMRGVVLAGGWASDDRWVADGVRAVLPGLRIVVELPAPAGDRLVVPEDVDILAEGGGVWVGRRRRSRG
jgi:hypothetical protein